MSEHDNLVALVTGGSSGIGAAVVRRLAHDGARVAILDRDVAHPGEHVAMMTDVGSDESVARAIQAVGDHFDRIDIVVNCAGIGAQGDVTTNSDDEWHHVWNVNVVGMARVIRAALPWLRRSPSASVVNLASVLATAGVPQRVLYSATKGAVLAMTRALAADHIHEGIRFNAVSPGTTDTPWVTGLLSSAPDPRAERSALEARQPHGRLVTADEVAAAVTYLTSPLSGSTTGTSIAVDGGMQELRLRTPRS